MRLSSTVGPEAMANLTITGTIPRITGYAFVALGLILNEFTLSAAFKGGESFGTSARYIILFANISLVAAGLLLIVKKTIDFGAIIFASILSIIGFGLVELVFIMPMKFEFARSIKALHPIAYFNYQQSRNLIQYLPDCGRYHEKLTYVLKSGECIFSNVEFSNHFSINSAGFRDDEESLARPEIVVVGDSQAMGWGVEQEQTFAQILERRTGRRVLNTAVSSYGTAREMMVLGDIDTSNMKVLIIQYHENDYDENREFFNGNGAIKIMPESSYDCIARRLNRDKNYFVGKYIYINLRVYVPALYWIERFRFQDDCVEEIEVSETPEEQSSRHPAELVRYVIENSGIDLSGVHVIFLETSSFLDNTDIVEKLAEYDWPGIKRFTTIEVRDFLDEDDSYRLDDHLNSSGHARIADALQAAVESR